MKHLFTPSRRLAMATALAVTALVSSFAYSQPALSAGQRELQDAMTTWLKDLNRADDPARTTALAKQDSKFGGLIPRAVDDIRAAAEKERGKMSIAEYDKHVIARSRKAGAPDEVIAMVSAAGGATRVFASAEGTLRKFHQDIRSESKLAVLDVSVDRLIAALTLSGTADAGIKRGACTFVMWLVTVGTSPDSAYKLCDRYST